MIIYVRCIILCPSKQVLTWTKYFFLPSKSSSKATSTGLEGTLLSWTIFYNENKAKFYFGLKTVQI